MKYLLMSGVARRAGCHERTIRNYLASGLLCTERLPNGVHLFVESDMERIRQIRASRKVGRPPRKDRQDA
jgi:DNA-binding transcriptional MerR regulator